MQVKLGVLCAVLGIVMVLVYAAYPHIWIAIPFAVVILAAGWFVTRASRTP